MRVALVMVEGGGPPGDRSVGDRPCFRVACADKNKRATMARRAAAGAGLPCMRGDRIGAVSGRAALHKDDDVGDDPKRGDRCQDDRNDNVGFGVVVLFFALHGWGRSQAGTNWLAKIWHDPKRSANPRCDSEVAGFCGTIAAVV